MSNAKAECEVLLDSLLPFAEEMLAKHREFYPFGGTLACDGKISHSGAWTGDEHPPAAELIALLQRAFQAGAKSGEYKASALVLRCPHDPTWQEGQARRNRRRTRSS